MNGRYIPKTPGISSKMQTPDFDDNNVENHPFLLITNDALRDDTIDTSDINATRRHCKEGSGPTIAFAQVDPSNRPVVTEWKKIVEAERSGHLAETNAHGAAPPESHTSLDVSRLWNWTISDVYTVQDFSPMTDDVDSDWVGKLVNIRLDHNALLDRTYANVSFNSAALFETQSTFITYLRWIQAPGVYQFLPWRGREGPRYPYFVSGESDPGDIQCPPPGCSSFEDCIRLYDSLNQALEGIDPGKVLAIRRGGLYSSLELKSLDILFGVATDHTLPPHALNCPILLGNTSATGFAFYTRTAQQCFSPTISSWQETNVDSNLAVFRDGGVDDDGVFHLGIVGTGLSSALRKAFLGGVSSDCSIESICEPPAVCTQVGTRFTLDPQRPLFQSSWAYNMLTAIANINQQMFNQYQALQSAAIESALATFNMADYWPKPSDNLQIKNIITGLGVALAAVSGFIPFLGPELIALQAAGATVGGLGAVAGGAGTFFERSLARNPDLSDPNISQKRIAPFIRQIFRVFSESLDNITAALLRGERIGDEFDVYDMIKGGLWVDRSALSRIAAVQAQLFNEIISRAINSLWKNPTSNKMWVLYVDLEDDDHQWKCGNDTSGPQTLKYCADGGVYYAYNFVEKGDKKGYRDYPWGADKLYTNLGIDPSWITEASAKTYQLTKNSTTGYGLDPFNFDASKGANNTLFYIANGSELLGSEGKGMGGRYPGSWTLPVCNASKWGASWNIDYTLGHRDRRDIREHPPCFCGEGGTETAHWAIAAGLSNFDTFYERCKRVLKGTGGPADSFSWPVGVASVDLGFREPVTKPSENGTVDGISGS
ncbi:MAG: hypothetical protein Q9174_003485 [Haloplaca sp. 1 TL-2023]